MKILKAGYMILDELDGHAILSKIETCGRICYKSERKMTSDSSERFVEGLIKRGHESVLEHVGFSVLFRVDRGVSHEIVRHRIASYSQESTRYCNYGHDGEITVIEPCFWGKRTPEYEDWEMSCRQAERTYITLLTNGAIPEEARSVLPNSLKTELVMTADLREWRHFLKLRTSPFAHPQMREVTIPLLTELNEKIPVVFKDIIAPVLGQFA